MCLPKFVNSLLRPYFVQCINRTGQSTFWTLFWQSLRLVEKLFLSILCCGGLHLCLWIYECRLNATRELLKQSWELLNSPCHDHRQVRMVQLASILARPGRISMQSLHYIYTMAKSETPVLFSLEHCTGNSLGSKHGQLSWMFANRKILKIGSIGWLGLQSFITYTGTITATLKSRPVASCLNLEVVTQLGQGKARAGFLPLMMMMMMMKVFCIFYSWSGQAASRSIDTAKDLDQTANVSRR